jgi:sensor domain CHASE-containing protein
MKSTLICAAALAVSTEAFITSGKAAYLSSRGVDMKSLHERHERVVTRAFHKKLAVTK